MKIKSNVAFYIVIALSVTIVFYIAKITPISPIYIVYPFLFLIAIPVILKYGKVNFSADTAIVGVLLLYTLITQFEAYKDGSLVNLVLALTAYALIRTMAIHLSTAQLIRAIYWMLFVSVALLFIDTAYRLMHPGVPGGDGMVYIQDEGEFYKYKYNSIMFADSNTTGLISLILYFSMEAVWPRGSPFSKAISVFKSSLILLIFLSLSRAAILAFIVFKGYSLINFQSKAIKIGIYVTGLILVNLMGWVMYETIFTDRSFGTKVDLIELVSVKMELSSTYEVLLGHGLGSSPGDLGRATHLLFLTYLYEMGMTGLAIILLFFWRYGRKYGYTLILPVLFAGLSYFLYVGAPFLFVPMALIASYKDNLRRFNA